MVLFYEHRLFCPNTGTKFRKPYHPIHEIPHRENFSQIYQAILEKKLILMVLAILVLVAILDSRPGFFYRSKALQSGHAAGEI